MYSINDLLTSTICPLDTTAIMSASLMVLSLCAMISTVLPVEGDVHVGRHKNIAKIVQDKYAEIKVALECD